MLLTSSLKSLKLAYEHIKRPKKFFRLRRAFVLRTDRPPWSFSLKVALVSGVVVSCRCHWESRPQEGGGIAQAWATWPEGASAPNGTMMCRGHGVPEMDNNRGQQQDNNQLLGGTPTWDPPNIVQRSINSLQLYFYNGIMVFT